MHLIVNPMVAPPDSALDHKGFQDTSGWVATASTQSGKFTGVDIPPGNRRPT